MGRFTFYSSGKEDSCSLSRCMCTSMHTYSRPSLLDSVSCGPPVSSVHGIYWNGLPFPTAGHLPDLGIKPASLGPVTLVGGTTVPSVQMYAVVNRGEQHGFELGRSTYTSQLVQAGHAVSQTKRLDALRVVSLGNLCPLSWSLQPWHVMWSDSIAGWAEMYVGRLLPFLQILAFPHTDKDISSFLRMKTSLKCFQQFQLGKS